MKKFRWLMISVALQGSVMGAWAWDPMLAKTPSWTPSKDCLSPQNTIETNQCANEQLELTQGKLKKAQGQWMAEIKKAQNEKFAQKTMNNMDAWNAYVTQDCDFQTSFYEGGSIVGVIDLSCRNQWTAWQMKQFRNRVELTKKKIKDQEGSEANGEWGQSFNWEMDYKEAPEKTLETLQGWMKQSSTPWTKITSKDEKEWWDLWNLWNKKWTVVKDKTCQWDKEVHGDIQGQKDADVEDDRVWDCNKHQEVQSLKDEWVKVMNQECKSMAGLYSKEDQPLQWVRCVTWLIDQRLDVLNHEVD